MTDEEKLTLIQKYEELPEEEFKEECFEDLKKFAFDKDDTVKTFTASVLSRFVNTAKQKEAIEILLQLCREENELIRTEAYDAIGCYCEKSVVKSLEKESPNTRIMATQAAIRGISLTRIPDTELSTADCSLYR